MKSPFTGREMTIKIEEREILFRKEPFTVDFHVYRCDETGEEFTDDQFGDVNMNQVYNQYRAKYHLPFPDDIKALREKYGLPAIKMAEVLGFGANVYRNYESGEIPSQSNARLIQLAQDPEEFKKLIKLSGIYEGKQQLKILDRIDKIISEEKDVFSQQFQEYLMGENIANIYSGYRKPRIDKFTEMTVYFTERIQPYKTKMNKLLFYADFAHFRNTCFSISGARYRAIDMGPVPNNFNSLFEYIANNNDVAILQTEFADGKMGEQFMPNPKRNFNRELFSKEELLVLEQVVQKFEKNSSCQIARCSLKNSLCKRFLLPRFPLHSFGGASILSWAFGSFYI